MSAFTVLPIKIHWGHSPILHTVQELAGYLVNEMTPGVGPEYLTALMVCHAVLTGSEGYTAEDCRSAFLDAVHEAGLTVWPDDDFELNF